MLGQFLLSQYFIGRYVDDCDLFQSGEDPLLVLQSMQELINSWGELVEVTGGALRPDKSWWYLVEYVWSKGKWRAANARDDLDLVAKAPNGEEVSLKRLHVDEAAQMLGIWMSPSGNNKKIVSTLKKQSLEWAAKVRLGRPSQEEAMVALKVNVSARLKYPLACCTLSEKDCKSIMYPAVRAALGKAGIASNLSTRARDGPITSGGAGILSLYHYQGTSRIAALIEQVVRKTPTGSQIIMCIEDLVLDTGMYGRLWDMPFEDYCKYVPKHSWIFAICEYIFKHNIEINCDHATLSPNRTGDRSIMEKVCQHFNKSSDLRSINRIRQFHGVIHLSDLASADGRYINPEFLSRGQFDGRRNDYLWPTRHHVTTADYTAWRKAMEFLFPVTGLLTPLRQWNLENMDHWLNHWDWFTVENREFLFRQVGENEWRRHIRVDGNQYSFHKQYLIINHPPPATSLRATVRESRTSWILTCSNNDHTIQNDDRPPAITFDAITITTPTIAWFSQHYDSSHSTQRLLHHLLAGTAIAVSDGSYFEEYDIGACGWIIATPDGEEWIEGGGLVPDASDSYRCELAGQVGIASFLESIIIDNPNGRPQVTVSCDGLSALNRTGLSLDALRASGKHMDLVSILSTLWDKIPFTIAREHVYGHQDEQEDRVLTILESLNCKMDEKAKMIAQHQIDNRRRYRVPSTHLGFGTIKCHGTLVTSHIQKSIYTEIVHKGFVERLGEKLEIDPQVLETSINWKAYGKARKAVPLSSKTFITKWLSNTAATGVIMKNRGHRKHSNCPLCNAPEEDIMHVMTCRSTSASELRETQLQELQIWLRSRNTDPSITSFLITGLRSWFRDPYGDEPLYSCPHPRTFRALTQQLELGWFALLCGYITSDLSQAQHNYFRYTQRKKHGNTWAKQLSIKLWSITFNIWKHRNHVLHDTDAVHQLSGMEILKQSITAEYNLGQDELPRPYSPFFYQPLLLLLRKSHTYLKRWFMTVRAGRESYYENQPITDEFTTDTTLRVWIGLSPLE